MSDVILETWCSKFGHFEKLTKSILRQCKSSVYLNPDPMRENIQSGKTSPCDFFELQPYFTELQCKHVEKKKVEDDMYV